RRRHRAARRPDRPEGQPQRQRHPRPVRRAGLRQAVRLARQAAEHPRAGAGIAGQGDMSLIYDALKEQAGPATTGRARTRASWWADQPALARTSMLLAGLLVLVVPLTYFVTSALKHHTVPPQQAMATNSLQAPVVRAATKVMPPADVPVREPVLAETSIPAPLATISAPEPAVLPGSATDTAMEPRVAEPATTATPAPAAITAVTSDTK